MYFCRFYHKTQCEGFAGASTCAEICGQPPADQRNDVEPRAELRDGHLQLNP